MSLSSSLSLSFLQALGVEIPLPRSACKHHECMIETTRPKLDVHIFLLPSLPIYTIPQASFVQVVERKSILASFSNQSRYRQELVPGVGSHTENRRSGTLPFLQSKPPFGVSVQQAGRVVYKPLPIAFTYTLSTAERPTTLRGRILSSPDHVLPPPSFTDSHSRFLPPWPDPAIRKRGCRYCRRCSTCQVVEFAVVVVQFPVRSLSRNRKPHQKQLFYILFNLNY
jgi:hypothetical protein